MDMVVLFLADVVVVVDVVGKWAGGGGGCGVGRFERCIVSMIIVWVANNILFSLITENVGESCKSDIVLLLLPWKLEINNNLTLPDERLLNSAKETRACRCLPSYGVRLSASSARDHADAFLCGKIGECHFEFPANSTELMVAPYVTGNNLPTGGTSAWTRNIIACR